MCGKSGTKVSGERLNRRRKLTDGDVIEIIEYRLLFEDDAPESDTSTILGKIETLNQPIRPIADVSPDERLQVIVEIVRELVGILDPDLALGRALEALLRIFPQAERGIALFRDVENDALSNPCAEASSSHRRSHEG
jgi:hypothetical protein